MQIDLVDPQAPFGAVRSDFLTLEAPVQVKQVDYMCYLTLTGETWIVFKNRWETYGVSFVPDTSDRLDDFSGPGHSELMLVLLG